MESLVDLIIFLSLLTVGYVSGRGVERRHFAQIRRRESELAHIATVTANDSVALQTPTDAKLCIGSVVVAMDYFKGFSASLRNFFGGRVTAFESLLDRGRREAILRMKESAASWGGREIHNVRIETSTISKRTGNNKMTGSIEVIAYGTAVR